MNAAPSAPALHDTPRRGDDHLVGRLQKSEIFRDYQEAFQTATGLPLVLRAAGAFDAPLAGAKNGSAFCALMAAKSKTCAACLQMQQRAESEAAGQTTTLECFAGLSDSLVPIHLGENVVAYLQTGQVMFRAPSENRFRHALTQILAWNAGASVPALHAAFFKTRVLTKAHYEAMLRLLASFAQHLSLVANELMIAQTTSEPLAVTKARAFIAEHLDEELSLEQVARAAGMSAFYFCKVFKGATGVTFTDYVARARVEQTKQLLLNPNTRISEAAYAAGFQSLSQFNRVFRRIEGQAPTAYREHLHGAEAPPAAPARNLAFAA
ncbi:MAG TPA: helix-turn-helix domain-containing protein [Opitutaceae bacterium]|nr:helix-turn-helix domain-containing protein [Opitutaceae bacterium]